MITTERPTQLLIDGTWRAGQEDATFDVVEPATSEVMATAAVASPADVDAAVTAARAAFDAGTWSNAAASARAKVLYRIAELIRAEADQLATLEAAGYIFVFTTLGADVPATAILEIYRGRWQVELAFKRLKSLLALGHLKKVDPQGAKAWLQGKLLVAILIETLIALAERFFPWGYPLAPDSPSLPMAGNFAHAAPS